MMKTIRKRKEEEEEDGKEEDDQDENLMEKDMTKRKIYSKDDVNEDEGQEVRERRLRKSKKGEEKNVMKIIMMTKERHDGKEMKKITKKERIPVEGTEEN